MTTVFSGRQFNVGIGKEATRGTAIAATSWLPFETLAIDDEITVAKDETAVGVIEAGVGQEITYFESKATINGRVTDISFGLLLKALLGTETKATVETGVDSHTFTMQQSAQHPSLTISVVEPNSNSGSGYGYALSMLDELQVTFELDKYATYKATFKGNKGANLVNTVSYTAENAFRPQDGTFKLATNLAGLAAASAITIMKFDATFKASTTPDKALGSQVALDRFNGEFVADGSFELKYRDRSMIDTYMLADLAQACSITFANTNVLIGAVSHPTVAFRFAKIKMAEVSRKIDVKGVVTQTVKFTAFYSLSDSEMLDIAVTNTQVTAY